MTDSGYQHTELVVSVSEGLSQSSAEKHTEPAEENASAPAEDNNTDQASKDEAEPLVITNISSDEKQASLVGADDANAQEKDSAVPGLGSASVSAGEVPSETPVSASENGGLAHNAESDTAGALDDDPASATEGQGPQGEPEHLPEPPASPVSNTVASSTSTGTTNVEGTSVLPPAIKAPSANRLSISYASGTRRLLIDAEIVEKMTVMRPEGRIEVAMSVERLADSFKGIWVRKYFFSKPFFILIGFEFIRTD